MANEYPKIIINEDNKSVIPDMKFNLTVEQYYDLLHHTHKMSDLVSGGSSGNTIDDSMNNDQKIEVLTATVTEMSATIEVLQQTVADLQYVLEELT